jgi:hypothetical protein
MIAVRAGGKIPSLMNRRYGLLFLCFLVLAAVLILASSLHDVHFGPGKSFLSSYSINVPTILQAIDELPKVPFWKVILFWAALLINLVLFFYLLSPELRKRLLRQALRFAIGMLLLLIAIHYKFLKLPDLNSRPADAAGASSPGPGSDPNEMTFKPPEMMPWVTYLISLGVVLAFLVLMWLAYRWWMRSRIRAQAPLDGIAGIARSSLDDLASGRDWGDVIIRSYLQMNQVIGARRGLHRADATTPREFAERLERAGLPAQAVKSLTRLFESVRYGARQSSQSDVREAVACLDSILQACGVTQ